MIFLDKLARLLTPKVKGSSSKTDFLESEDTTLTTEAKNSPSKNGIENNLTSDNINVIKEEIDISNKQPEPFLELEENKGLLSEERDGLLSEEENGLLSEEKKSLLKIEQKASFAEQNFINPDKVFNDKFTESNPYNRRYQLNDASLIEKILPYLISRLDFPNWVYSNRYSVFTIVALYLAILAGFATVKFTFEKTPPLPDGIYLEFIEEQELVKEEEKKEELVKKSVDDDLYENVSNKISDENSTLEEELDLDYEMFEEFEDIDTEELLKEAELLDEAIRHNMSAYITGKDSLDSEIERERNMAKNYRDSLRKRGANDKFNTTQKRGNVTVSYNLMNRRALYLEIPAYLCEGGGKVVIDMVVNRGGRVVSAVIERTYGVTDDCVKEMAVWATKLAEFNVDNNAPSRQKGTMTYIFVAQ